MNLDAALSDQAIMLQDSATKRVRTYVYRFDTGEVLDLGAVTDDRFGTATMQPIRTGGDRITFPVTKEKLRLAVLK